MTTFLLILGVMNTLLSAIILTIINSNVKEERSRILNEIDKLEKQSHATKTPIYQETMLKRVREIVGVDS